MLRTAPWLVSAALLAGPALALPSHPDRGTWSEIDIGALTPRSLHAVAGAHVVKATKKVRSQGCGADKSQCWALAYVVATEGNDVDGLVAMLNSTGLVDLGGLDEMVNATAAAQPPLLLASGGDGSNQEGNRGHNCQDYFSIKSAVPLTLSTVMPPAQLQQARFVLVLREPIARLLAHYNLMRKWASESGQLLSDTDEENGIFTPCFRQTHFNDDGTYNKDVSFDTVITCAMDHSLQARDELVMHSQYLQHLEFWTTYIKRKQILVVAHKRLVEAPGEVVDQALAHFGVASRVADEARGSGGSGEMGSGSGEMGSRAPMPNFDVDPLSDDAIEVMRCDTLARLRAHFMPFNNDLYKRFFADRKMALSPEVEDEFPPFTVEVPCAKLEITVGDRSNWRQSKIISSADSSTDELGVLFDGDITGEVDLNDDAKLERLGVFDYMIPGQEVIFGVITGGGMQERYGSIAKTWCGSQLRACVYFSNETAPASEAAPVVTVDIAQELMLHHNYPEWALRSNAHWPIYRSAQLRFLAALHWLRQRVNADPNTNPKTAKFFGKAKWVALVDDDTFVFYKNLKEFLDGLLVRQGLHNTYIYTGLVAPKEWLPTSLNTISSPDPEVRDKYVQSFDLFVSGGSGSYFSRALLDDLDTQACVDRMSPSGEWWQWQSDWALGSCVKREMGLAPHKSQRGQFNQFICVDDRHHPFYCESNDARLARDAVGGIVIWTHGQPRAKNYLDGPMEQPCAIHPIKDAATYTTIWRRYNSSTKLEAKHVHTLLVIQQTLGSASAGIAQ